MRSQPPGPYWQRPRRRSERRGRHRRHPARLRHREMGWSLVDNLRRGKGVSGDRDQVVPPPLGRAEEGRAVHGEGRVLADSGGGVVAGGGDQLVSGDPLAPTGAVSGECGLPSDPARIVLPRGGEVGVDRRSDQLWTPDGHLGGLYGPVLSAPQPGVRWQRRAVRPGVQRAPQPGVRLALQECGRHTRRRVPVPTGRAARASRSAVGGGSTGERLSPSAGPRKRPERGSDSTIHRRSPYVEPGPGRQRCHST